MKNLFKNSLYLLLFSFFTHSCNNHSNHDHTVATEKTTIEKIDAISKNNYPKGFEILASNCISCHNAKGTFEDRIAPSLAVLKSTYLKETKSKEQFIEHFVSFVENPTNEKSKMPAAIQKYNIMPKMGYSKEQLTAVANYIYHNKVEKPDWYANHFENEKKKYANTSISDLEKGQQLAMKSKAVLGKNLMGTIKKSGTDAALTFCNAKAYPLIDSMATFLNANIKRVSNNPRNENNKANKQELVYINKVIAQLAKGEKVKGELHKNENSNLAYYPITTNNMCLQCHGKPKEQIKASTLNLLSELYPNDKAINYQANQLRGIWVVAFDRK